MDYRDVEIHYPSEVLAELPAEIRDPRGFPLWIGPTVAGTDVREDAMYALAGIATFIAEMSCKGYLATESDAERFRYLDQQLATIRASGRLMHHGGAAGWTVNERDLDALTAASATRSASSGAHHA